MSKDAKLGLVLGIALIIIIAVVFFRKDPALAQAASDSTAAVKPKNTLGTPVISDMRLTNSRRHTVVEGDTLSRIAVLYYNDASKFRLIYDANRDSLSAADQLKPGTVLIIPD
jgi:nucleoid-associated protein YgaU